MLRASAFSRYSSALSYSPRDINTVPKFPYELTSPLSLPISFVMPSAFSRYHILPVRIETEMGNRNNARYPNKNVEIISYDLDDYMIFA